MYVLYTKHTLKIITANEDERQIKQQKQPNRNGEEWRWDFNEKKMFFFYTHNKSKYKTSLMRCAVFGVSFVCRLYCIENDIAYIYVCNVCSMLYVYCVCGAQGSV